MSYKNPRYANITGGILIEQDDGIDLYIDSGKLYNKVVSGKYGNIAKFSDGKTDIEQVDEKIKIIHRSVRNLLDDKAKQNGYDNIIEACMYASVTNPYILDGQRFVKWSGAVRKYLLQEIKNIKDGTRPIPQLQDFILELPLFEDF